MVPISITFNPVPPLVLILRRATPPLHAHTPTHQLDWTDDVTSGVHYRSFGCIIAIYPLGPSAGWRHLLTYPHKLLAHRRKLRTIIDTSTRSMTIDKSIALRAVLRLPLWWSLCTYWIHEAEQHWIYEQLHTSKPGSADVHDALMTFAHAQVRGVCASGLYTKKALAVQPQPQTP